MSDEPKMPAFTEPAELVEAPVLPLADADLDRIEREIVVAYESGVPAPTWVIGSLQHAERAMRRLKRAEAALGALDEARADFEAEVEEAYEKAIEPFRRARADALEPVVEWHRSASGPLLSTARFFEGQLERWALERREADPKHGKSVALPSGRVSTNAGRSSTDVVDEELLLNQIEEILPANLAEACIRRSVSRSDLLNICSIHRVQELWCVAQTGEPWVVSRFDEDHQVGEVFDLDHDPHGPNVTVKVLEVLKDEHRVCFRADADVDDKGQESGGMWIALAGITVKMGAVTAKVVVG